MNDEELMQLTDELRAILTAQGFEWLIADIDFQRDPKALTLALVSAIESVTSDLAGVEFDALEQLGVEEVQFKPDSSEETERNPAARHRLFGIERRGLLREQLSLGPVLAALSERINGE